MSGFSNSTNFAKLTISQKFSCEMLWKLVLSWEKICTRPTSCLKLYLERESLAYLWESCEYEKNQIKNEESFFESFPNVGYKSDFPASFTGRSPGLCSSARILFIFGQAEISFFQVMSRFYHQSDTNSLTFFGLYWT